MSFAEFQIRLFAWKRLEQREWEKVRFIAWHAMTGFHQDPKKMPRSLKEFMKLDIDEKKTNQIPKSQIERFKQAMKQYVEQTKNNNKWQS